MSGCDMAPYASFLSCPLTLLPVACGGTSRDGTDEGGTVGDGGTGSRHVITAEEQEDDSDHTPSHSQSSEHSSFLHVHVHVCKWPCYVGCVHECAAIINIPDVVEAHAMEYIEPERY